MKPLHASPRPRAQPTAADRALFGEVLPYVWHALSRMGVAEADRDELAQEVVIAAYKKRHEYDPTRASPCQWCSGFVTYVARNHLRKKQGGLGPLEELTSEVIDERPGPEEQYMAQIHHRLLHEVLLPQVDLDARVVVIGIDLEELDFKTVAEQEQIPLSTAYARHRRGRQQLEDAYARHQRKHRARGLLVLPLTLDQLLAADRTIPALPAELVNRAWTNVQRALAWRAPLRAMASLPQSSALVLVPTFIAGAVVGAVLLSIFQSPPKPSVVVVQPEPPKSAPLGVLSTAAPDVLMPAVAALPTPQASSASPRDFGNAQRDFEVAYQAFNHGSYDAALAALAAHERNFPAGAFTAERKSLRARIAGLRAAGEPQK